LADNRLVTHPAVVDDASVPVSVLVVDDNPGFRSRARRWLEEDGYDVVAEAEDGRSALEAARRHGPSVVLLDVQLPDMSGFTVAEQLAREPKPPLVVLTSSRDAADFGDRLADCGARGFVAKAELTPDTLGDLLP
jgi:CheY-like chemotaxis protein